MTKDRKEPVFIRRLYCAKEYLLMRIQSSGRKNLHQLGLLKDAYDGQRCFIMGNGPSLRQTDLSRLKNEFTFGLNRIYLLFPQMGFPTTFLVSINRLVLEQVGQELLDFSGPLFLPWSFRRQFKQEHPANLHFLLTGCSPASFSADVRGPLWSGATVTYIALQLAFHMGFKQVILIGVDHSFSTPGPANTEVISPGDDPNHFSPDYFGKGFRWHLPDLERSERAYGMARKAYQNAGREILDATIGGKLQVFPKIDYQELF